jgi:ankyrin repeat protein
MDELVSAAFKGDAARVRSLVGKGVGIDSTDSDGDTVLTSAARAGHSNIIAFAIDSGATINWANKTENTALHRAAYGGHTESINLLLAAGANPNLINSNGYNPLLILSSLGEDGAIASLLVHAADFNCHDQQGVTPLLASIAKGKHKNVEMLLDIGVPPDFVSTMGVSALGLAANKGHLDIARLLLSRREKGASASLGSAATLIAALSAPSHSDEICGLLVDHFGVPSDYWDGQPVIAIAAAMGRTKVVAKLLAAGADPNGDESAGPTPLMAAISRDDMELASILIESGAQPSGGRELAYALLADRRELAILLLRAGAVINFDCIAALRGRVSDGYQFRTLEGPVLAAAWMVIGQDHDEELDHQLERLASHPTISSMLTIVRLRALAPGTANLSSYEGENAVREYLAQLGLQASAGMKYLEGHAPEIATIIMRNFGGVARRVSDEDQAWDRCLDEVATLIGRSWEVYEDGSFARATGDFLIALFPTDLLVEVSRKGSPPRRTASHQGRTFEDECCRQLESNGFVVRRTPVVGDQGADLVATKDGLTYVIQCKDYIARIGNTAVQQAVAARTYYGGDFAVVAARSGFTVPARELAFKNQVLLVKSEALHSIDVIASAVS